MSMDARSQVTSLAFKEDTQDIITSHGGSAKGGYCLIWSLKNKSISARLTGHRKRVLGVSINP